MTVTVNGVRHVRTVSMIAALVPILVGTVYVALPSHVLDALKIVGNVRICVEMVNAAIQRIATLVCGIAAVARLCAVTGSVSRPNLVPLVCRIVESVPGVVMACVVTSRIAPTVPTTVVIAKTLVVMESVE